MDDSLVGMFRGYTFVNVRPDDKADFIAKTVNALSNRALAIVKGTIETELWRSGKSHIIFILTNYQKDKQYIQNENGSYDLPVGELGDSAELVKSVIENVIDSCEKSGWMVTRVSIGNSDCLRLEAA